MANSVVFAHLMEEHGNLESELEQDDQPLGGRRKRTDNKDEKFDEAGPKKALMQTEERNTGAVTWSTYYKYLRFAGTVTWAPFILFLLTLSQVAQGMSMCNLLKTGGFSSSSSCQ
jgi:ATP-binding cassette, subfamily C (CFTR/MRP), member 1